MRRLGMPVLVIVVVLLALVGGLALGALRWLDAPDHSQFDMPLPPLVAPRGSESPEHRALASSLQADIAKRQSAPRDRASELQELRAALDARGAAQPIDARIVATRAAGVDGEWVIAPTAIANRRLLYLHGGGYVAGSARSHRAVTARLSALARAAVLAIDYRLMPEHPRRAGIDDCRAAYRWLLDNGPDGAGPLTTLIVAGDSAGGNLALSTIAWARDSGLRAAHSVVVMSPQTDATLSSPSMRANLATDIMQGPGIAPAVNAPRPIALWPSFALQRIAPNDPIVSPLLGELDRLPPTLLQASASEVFLGDAVRYANKARAQGSFAELELWPHTLHAWHVFDVPESAAAFARIDAFLRRFAP